MNKKKIIIGSRGSKLAMLYAKNVRKNILSENSDLNDNSIEMKLIKTSGDIYHSKRLSEIGGKGLFSKQIEEELLLKKIDIAVHALKDLPSIETPGLETKIFLKRNDPREVMISNGFNSITKLKPNSIIGTSSFRRTAQINFMRKDLVAKLIRGNVDTRIQKLENQEYDAIILAYAGIKILGLEKKISQFFSFSEMLPSVGQGIIALQTRTNDEKTKSILKKVNDENTSRAAIAERSMLKTIEGDCDTAVGGLAIIEKDLITLNCELFSLDGKKRFLTKAKGHISEANKIGIEAGKDLLKQAGDNYKKR